MKIKDVLVLYSKHADEGSFKVVRGKIKKYILLIGNVNIRNAFYEKQLKEFIFNGEHKAIGKYYALRSFFNFIQKELVDIELGQKVFPINRLEVEKFDQSEGNRVNKNQAQFNKTPVYLEKDFDLNILFKDENYTHLESQEAIIISKACIALGIGAGYDSGEMFDNKTAPKMKINDIEIKGNGIKVKNFFNSTRIDSIYIGGSLAEYIKEYYYIRNEYKNNKNQNNSFFIKIWNPKELHFDCSIDTISRKPYKVNELVYYVLKYISYKYGLQRPLKVTDLRYNLILHSLYKSNGASLHNIVKIFGFQPFVQDAFQKYCSSEQSKESFSFLLD